MHTLNDQSKQYTQQYNVPCKHKLRLFWETISFLMCTKPYGNIGPDLPWQKCGRNDNKAHESVLEKFSLLQAVCKSNKIFHLQTYTQGPEISASSSRPLSDAGLPWLSGIQELQRSLKEATPVQQNSIVPTMKGPSKGR